MSRSFIAFLTVLLALLGVVRPASAAPEGEPPVEDTNYWVEKGENPAWTYVRTASVNLDANLLAIRFKTDKYSLRKDNPEKTLAVCMVNGQPKVNPVLKTPEDRASDIVWFPPPSTGRKPCPEADRRVVIIPDSKQLVFKGIRYLTPDEERQIVEDEKRCETPECAVNAARRLGANIPKDETPGQLANASAKLIENSAEMNAAKAEIARLNAEIAQANAAKEALRVKSNAVVLTCVLVLFGLAIAMIAVMLNARRKAEKKWKDHFQARLDRTSAAVGRLDREVTDRDNRIHDLQMDKQRLTVVLGQRKEIIESAYQQNRDLTAQLSAAAALVQARDTEIQQWKVSHAEDVRLIEQKSARIEELSQGLTRLDSTLAERDRLIAEHVQTIRGHEETIRTGEVTIRETLAQIEALSTNAELRERVIESLRQDVEVRDTEIAEQKARASEMLAQIETLGTTVQECEVTITGLRQDAEAREAEIGVLKVRVNDLLETPTVTTNAETSSSQRELELVQLMEQMRAEIRQVRLFVIDFMDTVFRRVTGKTPSFYELEEDFPLEVRAAEVLSHLDVLMGAQASMAGGMLKLVNGESTVHVRGISDLYPFEQVNSALLQAHELLRPYTSGDPMTLLDRILEVSVALEHQKQALVQAPLPSYEDEHIGPRVTVDTSVRSKTLVPHLTPPMGQQMAFASEQTPERVEAFTALKVSMDFLHRRIGCKVETDEELKTLLSAAWVAQNLTFHCHNNRGGNEQFTLARMGSEEYQKTLRVQNPAVVV